MKTQYENTGHLRPSPKSLREFGVTRTYVITPHEPHFCLAGIDKGKLSRIINGKASITADTALRLATYFGTSADSWMNLRSHYDLEVARDLSLRRIEREVRSYQSSVSV